ncbi:MAG: proton-conducting transporter membrane subunit [Spirochaetota bacterium]
MIEFLVLFPFIAAPFLILSKKRSLNRVFLVTYIIGLIICAFALWQGRVMRLSAIDSLSPFFDTDALSRLFYYVLTVLFTACGVYSFEFLARSKDNRWDTYYTVFLLLFAASMNGAIFSAHLGLFWVFIEATTLTSSVLIYYDRTRASLEATWKYIFVCSIGIAFAFVGIIMLTIGAGGKDSLFFADLTVNAGAFSPFWLRMAYVFLLTGFGTKVGLAPVHAWKPDAYSQAPGPAAALLSGALSSCALAGIIRVTGMMSTAGAGNYARSLLLVMGMLSILVAAVFMLRVRNHTRMLAYSSIEHMGIIAAGIALGGPAVFAAMLHLVGHALTKGALFMTSSSISRRIGSKDISLTSGLIRSDSRTGWLWLTGLLAITAFPPFVTFISEFMIIKTMFLQHRIALAVVTLFLLTVVLYGMASPVFRMSFGKAPAKEKNPAKARPGEYLPPALLLAAALVLGVYIPQPIIDLLNAAAAVAGM